MSKVARSLVLLGVAVVLSALVASGNNTQSEENQAMIQADNQARIEEQVMMVQYDLMTDEMRMNGVVLGE